jgi:hypothetical protein
MTRDEIHAAHRRYTDEGLSLNALATENFERWGYKNRQSAQVSLHLAFGREGLRTRTRGEAQRLAAERRAAA